MAEKMPDRIIVTRFSAMGDVVLLLPALRSVLAYHPSAEIILVTRPTFAAFFQGIDRLKVHPAHLKGQHQGIRGLWRLFQELLAYQPTHWVDAHDVLRTQFLRTLAIWKRIPMAKIQKGRQEKKQWTRKNGKKRLPLPLTVDRYLACFQALGLGPSHIIPQAPYFAIPSSPRETNPPIRLGIAPFAQHTGKRWLGYPELIQQFIDQTKAEIWIFGGGETEKQTVDQWNFPASRVKNTIGQFTLNEEIAWMQTLDLMIANDSSNLHLATLAGLPTVSIWGATHPGVGFGPWPSEKAKIVQIPVEELPCRPCSVFGNQPCYRGDYACLTRLSPAHVFEQVKTQLPRI